jgi:coproporphyrinogen III oxidase
MHFNTRYLQTQEEWFGGGMDVTPCLPFAEKNNYHNELKSVCDQHGKNYYEKYKKWCDEYFYLHHRNEPRGIGGIFFDYLKSDDWDSDFKFVQAVGSFFHQYSIKTIKKFKNTIWSDAEKDIQLKKRSRYAEFNLLHDRGTRFGLETGGNIEAILMSMPPLAKWE